MALSDDMFLLKGVPLFADLDGEQLRLIAFGAEHRALGPGEVLFREGEEADGAYVVVSGILELWESTRGGEPVRIANASAGMMLSELALATTTERKFTALAQDRADVMRISRALFRRLLEEYPEVADVIRRRIAASLLQLAEGAAALNDRFT